MEGKTGRTKGKENTCRTVGITEALADSGQSAEDMGLTVFLKYAILTAEEKTRHRVNRLVT